MTDTAERPTPPKDPDPSTMSVLDHIAELRSTLMWALGMAFVAAIGAWFVSDWIIETLLRPVHEAGQDTLYFQAPMEGFLLKLKASAVVGLMLVLPLILFKVYSFVLPGLLPREKRVVTPLLVGATSLFYVGVSFCYLVLLPLVIRFALSFATDSLQPWLAASSYFDMAARLCLAFGLLFELPMVVFALSWVGLVDPKVMLKGWRYALVLILAVSALLTPPDIISQVLLGGPVMLLYIASVLISMLVRRRQKKARDREDEELRAEEQQAREVELRAKARPADGTTPRTATDRDSGAEDPPWVKPAPRSSDDPAASGDSDDGESN